jgi:hypothetical protein
MSMLDFAYHETIKNNQFWQNAQEQIIMSSADDNPDTKGLLDLFAPLQSNELILLGSENDPYGLDKLESLTTCNDGDDTGFWLNLEEFVEPMDASQWEVNGKVSTKIQKSLSDP